MSPENNALDAKVIELDRARPPAFSDEALALRFAERHRNELRYVAAWSRWLFWNGARWIFDDTLCAFDRGRRICREAAAECNKPKIASAIASAKSELRRPCPNVFDASLMPMCAFMTLDC